MTLLHRLVSVLRWVFRRHQAEESLDEELRAYLELSAADKIRDGLPPEQARRAAMLELGGVEQAKERVRTYRHGGWLDEIGRDLRYAVRMFARTPGFTGVVVLTLALGIGANTAIFGLIDALMLRWLPVRDPQSLVQLRLRAPDSDGPGGESFSYVIANALAGQQDIFSGVTGFSGFRFDVGVDQATSRVPGALVTGGYYDTLGLTPWLGRLLTPDDDRPGAPPTAVASFGYWERQLSADPGAVGRVLRVNGIPVTVVGVTPRGFVGANVGTVADLTLAAATLPQISPAAAPLLGSGNFWLRVLARPRPGQSMADVATRLNMVWPRIAEPLIAPHWPASRRKAMVESVFEVRQGGTGWTYLRDTYRKPLLVLMAGVAVVLLIACANVASLLLARATTRRREIAVRLAIGAGRGRLVRQLLIESAILSLAGAALGVGLASASSRFLVSLISTQSSQVVFDLALNWHVLAFTAAVAITTAVLFGVAPALQTTAASPSTTLKDDVRSGGPPLRLLPWLVTGQVALSLVLLAGAGLFVRTLQNLRTLDPGFEASGVLLAELEGGGAVSGDVLESLRRVPGVMSASVSTHTPLNGSIWSEPAVPAGWPIPERDNAFFIGASPAFFTTMQMRLLAGRAFEDRDTAASPAVAIVNEAYARRILGGSNPVGRHLAARVRGELRDLEIVGLVGNTNAAGLREAPPPTVYVAYAQLTGEVPATVAVRARGPLGQIASEVQQTLQSRLPATPIEVRPLSTQVADTIVQERMMAMLASAFGAIALTLACLGLYGLLAYSVAERTREIGIRMALGSPASRVVRLVLAGGLRLVLAGIVLGLPAAWAASRLVESMLFGLTPTDPATLGSAVLLMAAAAQLAAYLPARRASRVDPQVALRHE